MMTARGEFGRRVKVRAFAKEITKEITKSCSNIMIRNQISKGLQGNGTLLLCNQINIQSKLASLPLLNASYYLG